MLRLAFWATLLIMLIPVENDPKDLSRDSALVDETLVVAKGLYSDLSSLCERNKNTCDAAGEIGQLFEAKLRAGASLLINYLDQPENDPVTTGTTPRH